MSYRELRNFCETMRFLGYPRLISMDNFRTPNFELVADILDWIVHRFESPGASNGQWAAGEVAGRAVKLRLSDDISDEAHRVEFIRNASQIIALRTRIKLNTRKLYGADGYAVKELLKVVLLLHDALKSVQNGDPGGRAVARTDDGVDFSVTSKLQKFRNARQLSSDIVAVGGQLHDLVSQDKELKEIRDAAVEFVENFSRNLDSTTERDYVDKCIAQLTQTDQQNLVRMTEMCEELEKDEKKFTTQISRKKQEIERASKRLSALQTVRPAFMDEYNKLERELEHCYELYVERFRNLHYLDNELEQLNKEEQERMEENERQLKQMRQKLRKEEWHLLRGGEGEEGAESDEEEDLGEHFPPRAIGQMLPHLLQLEGRESVSDVSDEEDVSDLPSGSEDGPLSIDGSGSESDEFGG